MAKQSLGAASVEQLANAVASRRKGKKSTMAPKATKGGTRANAIATAMSMRKPKGV